RGLPDPLAGILELVRGRVRRKRLPPERLVLRRQRPAEPVIGRLARLGHRALPRRQRHQHGAQPRLSGAENPSMSIYTEEQARAILDKAIKASKADQCSASLAGQNAGNIRYALNSASTSGAVSDC